MQSYTFIVINMSEREEIKRIPYTIDFLNDKQRRMAARKEAGIDTIPVTIIWDRFGNDILYTRKKNRLVYIVDDARIRAGDYLNDPCTILDDPAALAAARTRSKRKPKIGERLTQKHHAARRADALTATGIKLDGWAGPETITSQNALSIKAEIIDRIVALRKEQLEKWIAYEKYQKQSAIDLERLIAYRSALTSYIRFNKLAVHNRAKVFTAAHAAQEAPQREPDSSTTPGQAEPDTIDCDFI